MTIEWFRPQKYGRTLQCESSFTYNGKNIYELAQSRPLTCMPPHSCGHSITPSPTCDTRGGVTGLPKGSFGILLTYGVLFKNVLMWKVDGSASFIQQRLFHSPPL